MGRSKFGLTEPARQEQVRSHHQHLHNSKMNKLLLICLAGAALVALSGAEMASEEQSVAELSQLREVRAADPGKGNGKNKGKGKDKKSRKNKANGAGKNKDKKDKKKARKQEKKEQKKSRRNRKNNNNRVNIGRSSCMNATCIDNAVTYMKQLKLAVKNFGKQYNRISTNAKQSSGKSSKYDEFAPYLIKLRETGGGNASNLTCNGEKNQGATNLKTLYDNLATCETIINSTCNTGMPDVNMTFLDACKATMDNFTAKANEAIKLTGADACLIGNLPSWQRCQPC